MTTFADAIAAIGMGSWPDWLAAVATSIAVLVAAFTYRKSRNDDHVAQARKVYVLHSSDRCEEGQWVDTGEGWAESGALRPWPDEALGYQLKAKGVHVRATVHNASDEVISNVEVVVFADNVEDWPQGPRDARYVIAAIPPGGDHIVHLATTATPTSPSSAVSTKNTLTSPRRASAMHELYSCRSRTLCPSRADV